MNEPTDDERKALIETLVMARRNMGGRRTIASFADAILAAGFRRAAGEVEL